MFSKLIEKVHAEATLAGQSAAVSGSTDVLVGKILANIVNPVVTLMAAVAVVIFLYGVFEFIKNADSSEDRKTGGLHMLWGAVGLFIMVTAYGIMNLILGTIGK